MNTTFYFSNYYQLLASYNFQTLQTSNSSKWEGDILIPHSSPLTPSYEDFRFLLLSSFISLLSLLSLLLYFFFFFLPTTDYRLIPHSSLLTSYLLPLTSYLLPTTDSSPFRREKPDVHRFIVLSCVLLQ